MVKQIIFSAGDDEYIQQLRNSAACSVGLIIGHSSGSEKEFAAGIVKCPNKVKDDGETHELSKLEDIDENWVAAYSGQIALSFPGGIAIIGLFISAKSSELKQTSVKLKLIASRVFRVVSKIYDETKFCFGKLPYESSTLWTLVHFDQHTSQVLSCKQYDMVDYQDIGRSVEFKLLNHSIQWSVLEASLHIDQSQMSSSKIVTMEGLRVLCDKISRSRVIFDGDRYIGSQILDPSSVQSGKGPKNKKSQKPQSTKGKTFSCQLYLPSSNFSNKGQPSKSRCYNVQLGGGIIARAFVQPGSTVEMASYALKCDMIRSLQQRCVVLAEEDDEVEQEASIQSLPFRVLAKDSRRPDGIVFSEYLFPGEPIEQCIQSFKDTLGISANENELVQELTEEKERQVMENVPIVVHHNQRDENIQESGTVENRMAVFVFALVAIALAVMVSMFISKS